MKARDTIPLFLGWVQTYRKPRTYKWYCDHFNKILPFLGDLLVSELRAYHLSDFISAQPWSDSYKSGSIAAVKRWGNWLVEREYLDTSPFTKVKKPKITPRDNVPTTEDVGNLLSKCYGPTKNILTVLVETGARPHEIRSSQVSWFQEDRLVVPLNMAKKGRPRKILLTAHCITLIKYLIDGRQPSDHIFLNHYGKPWTQNALRIATAKASGGKYAPYDLRHYFATNALEKGIDSMMVSNLMGHADSAMLYAVYGKPRDNALKKVLQDLNDAE